MVPDTFTNQEKIAANEIISSIVAEKVVTPNFVAVHCTQAKGHSPTPFWMIILTVGICQVLVILNLVISSSLVF
jgi:hypothetical protein